MNQKACIFVDGENFRHTIVDLFKNEFDQSEYLPKNADWGKFFDWIINQVDPNAKTIRTYWYVIERIDFHPYKFCDPYSEGDKLKALLSKDEDFKKRLVALSGQQLSDEMKRIKEDLTKKKHSMTKRLAGWDTIHSGIQTKHKKIEFRRAGAIQYNLFNGSLGKEKAVDVKLATDLITLKNIFDIAIIVSGDQDYVPAVQVIKDTGKHVVNVSFEKRNGELLPGGAWRLNQITDWSLKISYNEFKKFLNIP